MQKATEKGLGKDGKRVWPMVVVALVGGILLCVISKSLQLNPVSRLRGLMALLFCSALTFYVTCPKLAQPLAYHAFADQRCLCCGIPNTFDVISNIPFALVSAAGLFHLGVFSSPEAPQRLGIPGPVFAQPDDERMLWSTYFAGVGLVSIGSAYYHWKPSNSRLVWDRLPMTIAFMSILCAVAHETLGLERPGFVMILLLLVGAGSVIYWHFFDDLRLYIMVQFYSLILIPILYGLFPSRYGNCAHHYLFALVLYALAKLVEACDRKIFVSSGYIVSGHTLKHLFAGIATSWATVVLVARVQNFQARSV